MYEPVGMSCAQLLPAFVTISITMCGLIICTENAYSALFSSVSFETVPTLNSTQIGSIYTFLADRTIGRAFGTACRLSVVCDVLYPGKTTGPICMKFSGKVWTDHGTT